MRNGGSNRFDDFRIRKYASPEPRNICGFRGKDICSLTSPLISLTYLRRWNTLTYNTEEL